VDGEKRESHLSLTKRQHCKYFKCIFVVDSLVVVMVLKVLLRVCDTRDSDATSGFGFRPLLDNDLLDPASLGDSDLRSRSRANDKDVL
jgi:hypothetical protein